METRFSSGVAHVSALFVKTRPCRFFLRNQCTKGSACNFAHGLEEQRAKPNLRFTKLCLRAAEGQHCGDMKCRYAHSKAERRVFQAPSGIRNEMQGRAVERMRGESLQVGAMTAPAGVGAPSTRSQARARRVKKPDISRDQGASQPPSARFGEGVSVNCDDMSTPSMSVLQCLSEPKVEDSEFGSGFGFSFGSAQVSYQPGCDCEVSNMDDDINLYLVERNTFLSYENIAPATAGTKSEPVHGHRPRTRQTTLDFVAESINRFKL